MAKFQTQCDCHFAESFQSTNIGGLQQIPGDPKDNGVAAKLDDRTFCFLIQLGRHAVVFLHLQGLIASHLHQYCHTFCEIYSCNNSLIQIYRYCRMPDFSLHLYFVEKARWCSGSFARYGRKIGGLVVRSSVGLFIAVLFPYTRTFLPHYLSSPRCINGYRQHNAGGKPAMD